jgi:hypothetical protein
MNPKFQIRWPKPFLSKTVFFRATRGKFRP